MKEAAIITSGGKLLDGFLSGPDSMRHRGVLRLGLVASAWTLGGVAIIVVGVSPKFGPLLLLGVLLMPLLLCSSIARFSFVLFGGLIAFQSSSHLSATKVGYLCACVGTAAISSLHLRRTRRTKEITFALRGLSKPSVLVWAMLLLSAVVSNVQSSGISTTAWARDIVVYALVPLLIPVAVDAGLSCRRPVLYLLTSFAAVFSSLNFAVTWLHHRSVSTLTVGQFGLSSAALIGACFCVAVGLALRGAKYRAWWGALAVVLAGSVLLTGARTGFILLLALAGLAGRKAAGGVSIARVVAVALLVTTGLVVAIPLVANVTVSNKAFLSGRLRGMESVLSGHPSSGGSFEARLFEYREASAAWHSAPWLGVGAGFAFLVPTDSSPQFVGSSTLDTPLGILAKFGVLGTLLEVGYLGGLAGALRRIGRQAGRRGPAYLACRLFCVLFILELPFGGYIEDKGFPLALMLLGALVVSEALAMSTRARANQPGTHFAVPALPVTDSVYSSGVPQH